MSECVRVCVCVCSVSLHPSVSHSFILLIRSVTKTRVETVMNEMINSCYSGQSTTVTADHLTSLLGLTDRTTAVKICSLYSKVMVCVCVCVYEIRFYLKQVICAFDRISLCLQDDTVDMRQVCLSVSAVSGFRSLESLIHTAFTVSVCHGCVV